MRLARLNPGFVTLDATHALSKASHDGKTLFLTVLTGHTITLPPATGSQCNIRIVEKVAATSGSQVIKVQNTTDVMIGNIGITSTTSNSFATAATSDTITLNRTTTGGATNGGWYEFEDIAAGFWTIRGNSNGSGTPASPFSAGV